MTESMEGGIRRWEAIRPENTSQYRRRDVRVFHISLRCWIYGFIDLFFSLLKRSEYEALAYRILRAWSSIDRHNPCHPLQCDC